MVAMDDGVILLNRCRDMESLPPSFVCYSNPKPASTPPNHIHNSTTALDIMLALALTAELNG